MDPIEEAIKDLNSREPGEDSTYTKVAKKYNVSRVTLARRHKGVQESREVESYCRRKLSVQQEAELLAYIEKLTKKGLPPTRAMVRNFASCVAKERVGEGWVTRFINRNKDSITSQWTTGMDRTRHEADLEYKYTSYFTYVHQKIA